MPRLVNPAWKGFGVYRLYDPSGRLLYLGKASNGPATRVRRHRMRLWGARIRTVTWVEYPSEAAALTAEAQAIAKEAPRYNRQLNRGRGLPDHVLPPQGVITGPSFPIVVARVGLAAAMVGAAVTAAVAWW